jgi:hypothetical protein
MLKIVVILCQILRTNKNGGSVVNHAQALKVEFNSQIGSGGTPTNLVIHCNGECVSIDPTTELDPTNGDHESTIAKLGQLVYIVVAHSGIVHGAQNIEVHILAPLISMPDLTNNTVLWNFWVYVN